VEGSGDMAPLIRNPSASNYDCHYECYFDIQHADLKVGPFLKRAN
jgi:hypothetical protein